MPRTMFLNMDGNRSFSYQFDRVRRTAVTGRGEFSTRRKNSGDTHQQVAAFKTREYFAIFP